MASYKDPANLTFNPYVQKRPVEAMMKVGVYKQQRYDEGVQKIQESIDNIAGLDVVRDVDKQYLQSKLNQLGSQLSMVAGGDFSNFQLVNSVNGMTNQIAKDPNVINAVSSAARYRKALEEKQKIVQEGKGSASNDWLFNNEASAWLNSDDINAQYSGMYRPYKDYNKAAQDVIKNLAKEYHQGDVAYNEKGQLVDAITRTKIEGITPERIQTALKAGLSPDDWQQMQIDGRYKYSNVSDEGFVSDINNQYTGTFDYYSKERDNLIALKNAAASSTERQRIQGEIESLDRTIENVRTEYNAISSGFGSGEVESAKAQLYTTNWMDNMANAFSTRSVSQTYETNPLVQAQLRREQMRQTQENFDKKYEQDERYNEAKLKLDQQRNALLGDAKYGELSLPTGKEKTSVEVVATVNSNLEAAIEKENNIKTNYYRKYKTTPEQFFIDLAAYEKSPNSVSIDKQKDLYAFLVQQKAVDAQDSLIRTTEYESRVIADAKLQALVPKEMENTQIAGYGLADAATLFDRFNDTYITKSTKVKEGRMPGAGGGVPTVSYNEEQAARDFNEGKLSAAEYELYSIWLLNKTGALNNDVTRTINSISRKAGKIEEERLDYLSKEYKESYLVPQQKAYNVPLATGEDRDAFRSPLNALATAADRTGGLPNAPDLTGDKIRSISADLNSASVYTDGAGEYSIFISDKDGTSVEIPLGQDQYDEIFMGRYDVNPDVASFNQYYLTKMLSTPSPLQENIVNGEKIYSKDPTSFYTTSMDGDYNTTVDNAYLKGRVDFPNVQYYGISGNLVSDGKPTEDGLFKLQLNIYDPVSQKQVEEGFLVPAAMDKASVVPSLQKLTDEVIWQFLNNTQKDIPREELIKLEKASQTMQ